MQELYCRGAGGDLLNKSPSIPLFQRGRLFLTKLPFSKGEANLYFSLSVTYRFQEILGAKS
jgi:hypothetical protein